MLFGAPGVGKGTFGKLIQKDFDFKVFSTGDYFRDVIKMSKQNGGEMDSFTRFIADSLKSGKLIDDKIVFDIIKKLMEDPEFMGGMYQDSMGIIFDGFPRTMTQAKMLIEYLEVDLIFNFIHREDILFQKLFGRRVCPKCNKNFNFASINREGYVMEPILPKGSDREICDAHGDKQIKLIKREDD
jgi:adenylate kinase